MSEEEKETELEEQPVSQNEGDEHEDVDDTAGDSDVLDESDESGEKATKEKDEPLDIEFYKRQADTERIRREDAERRAQADRELAAGAYERRQAEKYAEQERERLNSMSPEERIIHEAKSYRDQTASMVQAAERRISDANDRADFIAKCAKTPALMKYADDVEKAVQEAIKTKGIYYTRDSMLDQVIGQRTREALVKGGDKKQQRAAKENVKKSKTSASPSGGDRSKPKGKDTSDERSARNARLAAGPGAYQ